jgi:hypothetical protein
MNIDITMAPKDLYNIEGLCGQFDNKTAHDFRHRDGNFSEINDNNRNKHFADFTESWRYYYEHFDIIVLLPLTTKRLYCTIISVFLILCANVIIVCAYSIFYVHSLFCFAHIVLCYVHLGTYLVFEWSVL